MLIALLSAKGAPGVTATGLALALSWPRHGLLVECDPRGGDILAGFGAGRLPGGRGLLDLVIAGRDGTLDRRLWDHVVRLPDHTGTHFLLPGLEHAGQAGAVDWLRLADLFRNLDSTGVDVLADCGEFHARHAPLPVLRAADLVVLVTRGTLPAVRATLKTAALVQADLQQHGFGPHRLAAVIVEAPGGYPERDIAAQFASPDIEILGTLPHDGKTARVLTLGTDHSDRYLHSRLLKAASAMAHTVGNRARTHHNETGVEHGASSVGPRRNGVAIGTGGRG